jgi:cell division protein FtsI/penicillin-binding protein 2
MSPAGQWDRLPISSQTFNAIATSLVDVVEEGTGWRAKSSVVQIAGKTGTAEVGKDQRPHNWFIAWAPATHPLISIVVLVESREEDISIAPQIAGNILTRVFSGVYPNAT